MSTVSSNNPLAQGTLPVKTLGNAPVIDLSGLLDISGDNTVISNSSPVYRPIDDLPDIIRATGEICSLRTFDTDYEFNQALSSNNIESFVGVIPFDFPHGLTGVVDGTWLRLMKRYGKYWNEIWRGVARARPFDFLVSRLSVVIHDMDQEKDEMESLGFIPSDPWRYGRLWNDEECEYLLFVERNLHTHSSPDIWNMEGRYAQYFPDNRGTISATFSGKYLKLSDMAIAMVKSLVSEDEGVEILSKIPDRIKHEAVVRQLESWRIRRDKY